MTWTMTGDRRGQWAGLWAQALSQEWAFAQSYIILTFILLEILGGPRPTLPTC